MVKLRYRPGKHWLTAIVNALAVTGLVALGGWVWLTWPLERGASDRVTLQEVTDDVSQRFFHIRHVDPTALDHLPNVVLVDVRERDEFAISRLKGAVRISPEATAQDVRDRLIGRVGGRTIVFYCSVGVRSSRLADAARGALMSAGAKGVYNLKGGIFAWHNRNLPLVDGDGATSYVHPYDDDWGRFVERQSDVRYKPQ